MSDGSLPPRHDRARLGLRSGYARAALGPGHAPRYERDRVSGEGGRGRRGGARERELIKLLTTV